MGMRLILKSICDLLLPLSLTVLEVEDNIPYFVPWNLTCLLKIWNGSMLLISISLCYVVGLPTLAKGTLSTSTLEWIFSAPVFSV